MEDFMTWVKDWGEIVVIFAGGYGLFRALRSDIRKSVEDVNARIDRLAEDTREDIKELRRDFRALKDDFRALKDDFRALKDDFRALTGRVDDLFKLYAEREPALSGATPQADGAPAEGASPLALTEMGLRIAAMVDAKAIVEKYADRVMIPEDASKLKIQDACFRFALGQMAYLLNQQEKELVDEAIYQEGQGKPAVVYTVFGVLMRDYYLEKMGFEVPIPKSLREKKPSSPPESGAESGIAK